MPVNCTRPRIGLETTTEPPSSSQGKSHRDSTSDTFEKITHNQILAIASLAIPALSYLLFIHQYGLNTIAGDQWSDVGVIAAAHNHTLNISALWSQWAVERMFFPRLIALALYETSHFNTLIEMYVGAVLLFSSVALLIATHHRRSPSTPLLFYCPVAITMLSFVQYENTLWGFQIAWYMVLLALSTALFLLDRVTVTWWFTVAAITASGIGSFSSFQGLLIWPVGLSILWYRRRSLATVVTWCTVAVMTTALYFYHFDFTSQAGNDFYDLHHPIAGLQFFLFTLGEITGVSISYSSTNYGVIIVGSVILMCALWILVRYGLHRDVTGSTPLGIALISFGLLWALSLTITQSSTGLPGAAVSRFTTYDLLIPVGCYLVVLSRRERSAAMSFIRLSVISTIVVVAVFGTINGLAGGSYTKQARILEAKVTANARQATRSQLEAADPIDGLAIPRLAPIAQQLRLSLFGSGSAASYDDTGLGEGKWATAQVAHVVPWTDLTNGESVEIRGGGFLPDSTVLIAECGHLLAEAPRSLASLGGTRTLATLAPSPSTLATCSERTLAESDGVGRLKSSVTVSGDSCLDDCYLAVMDPQRTMLLAAAEIRFREQ